MNYAKTETAAAGRIPQSIATSPPIQVAQRPAGEIEMRLHELEVAAHAVSREIEMLIERLKPVMNSDRVIGPDGSNSAAVVPADTPQPTTPLGASLGWLGVQVQRYATSLESIRHAVEL